MSASGPTTYPRDREAEILLRDGSTAHVRPVRRDDGPALTTFLEGVSPESIGFRFFGTPNLGWVVRWSLDVDYASRYALVVEVGTPPAIVAHAAYVRGDPEDIAEVAFLVADAWQGKGISTILLAHLAATAEQNGISTFTALVLPYNHRMIEVFRDSGFPVEMRSTPDAIAIHLPTSLSPDAVGCFEERARLASVAAVRSFLEPSSVAVIGASRRGNTVGGRILHNLVSGGFSGPVYPVNRTADVVQGLPAYHSVRDIGAPVELAVVVVPAEHVVSVARECADAGVRALVVISAGFAEAGEEGARRQQELVGVCRAAGMRLVGPNCLGVLNTAPNVRLNATFAPRPVAGQVGFMSQSGGMGIAIIEAAGRGGLGLSAFVSLGNKVDISGNDMLRYWEQDENTKLALMYLESFGNPREFARLAPPFACRKPLIAVKSGSSAAGRRATASHTGALLSASDVTVAALFEQAGVVRTDTLHELLDVAALLGAQPVPRGERVAIVTNAGGPGVMCADACQAEGMEVPELPAHVREKLEEFLPAAASTSNPVDMIATATAEQYAQTLQALIDADACDAILAMFVPPLVTEAARVARAIRGVAEQGSGVTIAAVFMTGAGPPPELMSDRVRVPGYEFPENAARAVALAARYGRWRSRPVRELPTFLDARPDEAAAIISQHLGSDQDWLSPAAVAALLDCYGLPLIATRFVGVRDDVAGAAAALGYPVALKANAQGVLHKTDVGGVRLALATAEAVRAAAAEIEAAVARHGVRLDGWVVQPMAPLGVELIVGVVNDHHFGPVLACGAGGVTAELIKDVAVRITPLTLFDAHEMLAGLRTFPLLDGYRGAPRCDVQAVEEVLLRVSTMVEAHPEIVELDCNPLIAGPGGALIVDARVRVEPAPPVPPMPSIQRSGG